jgi:hypothetical protein
MALGDLTLNIQATFAKLNRSFPFVKNNQKIHVKGKYANMDVVSVGTSDGTFPLGSVGTPGYVAIANLEPSLVDTPSAPSVANVGSAGSTTYTYKVVAKQTNGGYTVASAGGTTTTGNATLDGTNFNRLTWGKVDDASGYDIYRTVGGATQGKIASVAGGVLTLDDTGLAGDGASAPSTTPHDFTVEIGSDGSSYPILVKGGDAQAFRWNAAAIHRKALFNAADVQILIIEQ